MKKQETKIQSYAASRAHVWLRCAASEENQKKGKNPFQERNPLADEGTLIHARAARALGKDIPETIAETQLFASPDSDAQSVVDFYVEAVKRVLPFDDIKPFSDEENPDFRLFVENDFSHTTKSRVYRNIPDAVFYDGEENKLTIFDLKTGFVPVAAEDNEQLLLGAHAVCQALKIKPDKITGIIVSPRLSSIEYADLYYDPDFFEKLDRELDTRKGRYQPGSHCKKCNLLTKCKAFRDTLEQYLDPSIKDGLTSKPDEWARTLAISGPARKFFEELESEAKEFLELGGTIPDFALRRTGGKRAWFRELLTLDIAVALGLKTEDLLEKPKMISVAQAEKKIAKADRDKLNALIYQPQNVSLTTVNEKSFLSREGEKIIKVSNDLGKITKNKGKKNGNKGKTKGKTKAKSKGR